MLPTSDLSQSRSTTALPAARKTAAPTTVVLDTNVVFDWLVFADPSCDPLDSAIKTGEVQWLATPSMQDECFSVLGHGRLDAWAPDFAAIRAAWAAHCRLVLPAAIAPCAEHPRCSDPDDQMFIDLAVERQAAWLLSKDRAVLRLAPRLRSLGVSVASTMPSSQRTAVSPVGRLPDRS